MKIAWNTKNSEDGLSEFRWSKMGMVPSEPKTIQKLWMSGKKERQGHAADISLVSICQKCWGTYRPYRGLWSIFWATLSWKECLSSRSCKEMLGGYHPTRRLSATYVTLSLIDGWTRYTQVPGPCGHLLCGRASDNAWTIWTLSEAFWLFGLFGLRTSEIRFPHHPSTVHPSEHGGV